jgi:hypothetical protein
VGVPRREEIMEWSLVVSACRRLGFVEDEDEEDCHRGAEGDAWRA